MNNEHEQCARCGRKLKTEKSRKVRMGPVCWKKYNADMERAAAEHLENDPDIFTNGELEGEGEDGIKK